MKAGIRLLQQWRPILVGATCFVLGVALGVTSVGLWRSSLEGRAARNHSWNADALRAELQEVSFDPVYNPNTAEFKYRLRNTSSKDYELPERFRQMRKSPDGILHNDVLLPLTFPGEVFVPAGHTVELSAALQMGNVLDHAPTDKDKAALLRRLQMLMEGTQSYVIFDEQHRYELELPVH